MREPRQVDRQRIRRVDNVLHADKALAERGCFIAEPSAHARSIRELRIQAEFPQPGANPKAHFSA